MNDQFIKIWKQLLFEDERSWVLFENGTCVVLTEPEHDLSAQAIELMKKWGPVHAGSPAGDFSTLTLKDDIGWVVTCHHNDILTYVAPEETGDEPSDLGIGMFGRTKRHQDATELTVIHVEQKE